MRDRKRSERQKWPQSLMGPQPAFSVLIVPKEEHLVRVSMCTRAYTLWCVFVYICVWLCVYMCVGHMSHLSACECGNVLQVGLAVLTKARSLDSAHLQTRTQLCIDTRTHTRTHTSVMHALASSPMQVRHGIEPRVRACARDSFALLPGVSLLTQ